jgi:enoyl-CoA hydratase/carnithine racemase
MHYGNVIVERKAWSGVVTINRPDVLNPIDSDTADEILRAFVEKRELVFRGR